MDGWKAFCGEHLLAADIMELRKLAREDFRNFRVYPGSIHRKDGCCFFMTWDSGRKVLVVYGNGDIAKRFSGSETMAGGDTARICPLTDENCETLRKEFPFTAPISHKGKRITIGLGDRLGLASPAHLRLIQDKDIFPVLAQQSIRELNLTGRTYHDVLNAASWAVFQESYTQGFGADGDHLKTPEEVDMALDCGFTMITLDCSDHMDNKAAAYDDRTLDEKYAAISLPVREALEGRYLNTEIPLHDGSRLLFEDKEFKRIVLVYLNAISHAVSIWHNTIMKRGKPVDFELSIDETLIPTTPEAHYFVADQLIGKGVEITSLAPKFCGEFQKGIDYIGDKEQFEREFSRHVAIAEHFGYKISIHSGSDKFSIFPIIGEKTHGGYHLKTAGTNWLEAVRTIACKNPALYREMHAFAVEHLNEARKNYHISADLAKVPDISKISNSGLPGLMDQDDARQVLHITYGQILQAKKADGAFRFRDRIYETLNRFEEDYCKALENHIGRHLYRLGIQ